MKPIKIIGAKQNYLKDITLEIPKHKLTVFTRRSGSGKSSLVFNTTAAVSGLMVALFNIQGIPVSAGFGYSGLVGPINALKFMEGSILMNLGILAFAYIVVPVIVGLVVHNLCLKFKVYPKEVFKFQTEE